MKADKRVLLGFASLALLFTFFLWANVKAAQLPFWRFAGSGSVTAIDQGTGLVGISVDSAKNRHFAPEVGKNLTFELSNNAWIGRYKIQPATTGSQPPQPQAQQNGQQAPKERKPSLPLSNVQQGNEVRFSGHFENGQYFIDTLRIGS